MCHHIFWGINLVLLARNLALNSVTDAVPTTPHENRKQSGQPRNNNSKDFISVGNTISYKLLFLEAHCKYFTNIHVSNV